MSERNCVQKGVFLFFLLQTCDIVDKLPPMIMRFGKMPTHVLGSHKKGYKAWIVTMGSLGL